MEMKQDETFFHGTHSNLTLFFIGRKILKYFNDSMIGTFQFHCKSGHKQVKLSKISQDLCKSDCVFPYL